MYYMAYSNSSRIILTSQKSSGLYTKPFYPAFPKGLIVPIKVINK